MFCLRKQGAWKKGWDTLEWPVGGAVKMQIFISEVCCPTWASFVVSKNIYSSNIKDHQNKYDNNEKVWTVGGIMKMWHEDMKWENFVGKNGANKLGLHGVVTNLQRLKN